MRTMSSTMALVERSPALRQLPNSQLVPYCLVLGKKGVGKHCLMNSLVANYLREGGFQDEGRDTLDLDTHSLRLRYADETTPSTDRKLLITRAQIVVVVYAADTDEGVREITEVFAAELRQNCMLQPLLVGTRFDEVPQFLREQFAKEGRELGERIEAFSFEIASAMGPSLVLQRVQELAETIMERPKLAELPIHRAPSIKSGNISRFKTKFKYASN